MSENAVAEPLSGHEIIEAIVYKVREQLARDCFLSPNSAYEYFQGKIQVSITAVDCGRQAAVNVSVDLTKGQPAALTGGAGYNVKSTEDINKQAPNVVRRETEQGVPVAVADGGGKVETKTVKYQRQAKPAAANRGVRTPVDAKKSDPPAA